ncbi:MAG TPA: helix-turn-helix domain-containing protein, partial [Planctomycetota bacterium]|nr:helix-turn-helix domain-containing protein [Planctomycetota bacterium]
LDAAGPALRVVGTTNASLAEEVRAGRFRADLYWRLNVLSIPMPPLREHREDLPELALHFLSAAGDPERGAGPVEPPSAEVLEVLASYSWPGNVRELENVVERALLVSGGRRVDVGVLRGVLEPSFAASAPSAPKSDLHLRSNLDAAERELVLKALARSAGLKKQAAFLLGIDPRNLGYYLRKHGVSDVAPRGEPEQAG